MFEPRVVAAIDFGTHGTGFAWSVVEDCNKDPRGRKIHFCNRWESQPDPCAKNLSALLLDEHGELIAWGYEARRYWLTGRSSGGEDGLTYHAAFKMDLMASGIMAETVLAEGEGDADAQDDAEGGGEGESQSGNALGRGVRDDPAVAGLITKYLRRVVERALEQITASGYDEEDIRWCLTVPAIWSDYQKMVMRDVAKNAGLPTDASRLILALEPEAAAHHARVSGVSIKPADGQGHGDLMSPGARFMVADCGGGTVDITAYENDHAGRMIEIGRVDGGKLGSNYLNKTFEEQFLVARFGSAEVVEDLRANLPEALLELTNAWERAKLHIKFEPKDPVYLNLPAAIDRRLGATMRRRLGRLQSGTSDALVITAEELRSLFDNVVPDILDLIEGQLAVMDESRGADSGQDAILLVGGFGSSPYLQEAVRERFGHRAQVVVPPDPNVAVLHGAVHFCYEPHTRARRSKFTYGVDTCMAFEEGIDPEETLLVTSDGRRMCNNRFSVFVNANSTVESDAVMKHRYVPVEGTQTAVDFALYATRDAEPRYISDEGCDEVGFFTVDLSRAMRFSLEERSILMHMRFGETEVKAWAVLEQTGETVETGLRFHSNY